MFRGFIISYQLFSMMLLYVCFSLQLEDVNSAYNHDEIRFDEKHQELLTKFETERTQDKTKYEVPLS